MSRECLLTPRVMPDDEEVGSLGEPGERCSVQGSPPRRPAAGAAAVPSQHGAAQPQEPAGDPAPAAPPALPGPRSAPGGMPVHFFAGARAAAMRPRLPARPDTVVFTAACPACGQDCVWSEEREDTRLTAVVSCPCPG